MSHHENKDLNHIKKKGVIFLAVLVLSAALYLGFTSKGDLITTSAVFPGGESQSSFNVNAMLQMSSIEMDVEEVTLDIIVESGGLTINGLIVESGSQIVLTNFEGTIKINGSVTLEGTAESAVVDNVVLSGEEVAIEAEELRFSSLTLSNLNLPYFSLNGLGTIDVASKGTFNANNEQIELSNLNGDITFTPGTAQVTGNVKSIRIAGNPGVEIR